MVINGVINDNLATMSFNEHHYVVKRVSMSFPTLYYLGLEPLFGDYIVENNTLVVSGKLSKRDLLKKQETIYGGIIINKDEESIDIDNIKDNTKYLKNIDIKTGQCFSRIYVNGYIKRHDFGLYSYQNNDSIVLVTPNLDKKHFNTFDLKEKLSELFPVIGLSEIKDKFSVISVMESVKGEKTFFEITINFNNIDYIKAYFIIDENNLLKFYPYIYSEHFTYEYKLKENEELISASSFPYYFLNSELISSLNNTITNKETQKVFSRIYVKSMFRNIKDNEGCTYN